MLGRYENETRANIERLRLALGQGAWGPTPQSIGDHGLTMPPSSFDVLPRRFRSHWAIVVHISSTAWRTRIDGFSVHIDTVPTVSGISECYT